MANVTIMTLKKGDRFSFEYTSEETGKAAYMLVDVKPFRGNGAALVRLDVEESSTVPGKYIMSTDVDTTDWPKKVKLDVWRSDTEMHDIDTMIVNFKEAVTDGRA